MKQKTVIIAAVIGLVFGILFSGTLGLNFFGSDDNSGPDDNTDQTENTEPSLKKDEEGFRVAYNLTESIFIPIEGDTVADKLANGDSFILYMGRHTCPYCQQYVPNLQQAALNQGLTMIYHVDTIDELNEDYITAEGVNVTPTTYIVKDGVVVEVIIGFKTTAETEQLIIDNLL